jgi:hypothetical protein
MSTLLASNKSSHVGMFCPGLVPLLPDMVRTPPSIVCLERIEVREKAGTAVLRPA